MPYQNCDILSRSFNIGMETEFYFLALGTSRIIQNIRISYERIQNKSLPLSAFPSLSLLFGKTTS